MFEGRFRTIAAAAVLAVAAAACTPVRDQHGFVPDSPEAAKVEAGVDTKATVLARLGTPSTTSAFDGEAWYYISAVQERLAFYTPKTAERTVIAVRFGADDVVSGVETFGIEKGKVVAFNADETPTRGRELGLVEQIFGNIGRNPTQLPDEEEGRRGRR